MARFRGQFSIEFFLVLSLFALTLTWLNNYSQQLKTQDMLFPQQKTLSSQLALLAGEAFALNETIGFNMPCFVLDGKPVPFWVYADSGGITEITVLGVVRSENQSSQTVFPLAASPNPLVFNCKPDSLSAGWISFERTESAQNGVPGVLLAQKQVVP